MTMSERFTSALHAHGLAGRAQPADSVVSKPKRPRGKLQCEPPMPVCSDCGALKCLCRPRFFAGQLLTEQDLNRLDTYIREKGRLQNRHLHGWGVVNGLEVTCDPCGTAVVVGCGYALSPCGDDIVVCEDVAVDVCKLIARCREPELECAPHPRPGADGCDDLEEEWVLAIRYTESASRGIVPLRGGGCGCGSGRPSGTCGCGGTSPPPPRGSCGCGGGHHGSNGCAQTSVRTKPRNAPPECEPTVTCEGFAFEVFRKPAERTDPDDRRRFELRGPLFDRFRCCVEALFAAFPTRPGDPTAANFQANAAAWQQWCCDVKRHLTAYFSVAPVYSCEIVRVIQGLPCPDPQQVTPAAFAAAMNDVITALGVLVIEGILACFCSALLPPCPEPAHDQRVPLATIRVRSRDCAILSICNWTPLRRFVLTAPNLGYWLSPFSYYHDEFREMLHDVCCTPVPFRIRPRQPERDVTTPLRDATRTRINPRVKRPFRAQAAGSIAAGAVRRGTQPLDPMALVADLLGVDAGASALSEVERLNLPQFLLANQLVKPLVVESLPADLVATVTGILGGLPGAAPGGGPLVGAELGALRTRMRALETLIEAQERDLRILRDRLGPQ
jgi:hypothetical protein